MKVESLIRKEEYRVLQNIELQGKVLDLGGDTNAYYKKLFKGGFTVTNVNLDDKTKPDIYHNLEEKLPIENNLYDGVILINVLEHIFEYRQLMEESARVLKPNGKMVIAVPFMFPLHPSPQDYHRFTDETLRRECERLHLRDVEIIPLGKGVFSTCMLFVDRLMPPIVRFITQALYPGILLADKAFAKIAQLAKKEYKYTDYSLGYIVIAKK